MLIRVHNKDTDEELLLGAGHILRVQGKNTGSIIHLMNGEILTVKESPDTIEQKIMIAKNVEPL